MTEGPELWQDAGGFGLLTPADVAALSGFSVKTVRRAIAEGELVASCLRSKYRIWPEDYRRWIDDRRVEPRHAPETRVARRTEDAGPVSVARLRALEGGE